MVMRRSSVLLAAACLVVAAGVSGCSGGSGGSSEAQGATCTYEPDGRDAARKVDLPPKRAAYTDSVPATITLDSGKLTVTLDAKNAPCTVNSFASLAAQGYYDKTLCHRITTQGIFVLQCGDPTATGAGGPGYAYPDELSGTETYPAGTLAMANAGPDTNGSQFFIVYADTQLPPSYTVFGSIDAAGIATVKKIAAKGVRGGGPDGRPKKDVTITSISVDAAQ